MSNSSVRSRRAATESRKSRLPPLSPPFLSEEDAAYWVHTRIPPKPEMEYGSVILLRPDGKFVATSPIPGEATTFDLSTIIDFDALGELEPPKGIGLLQTFTAMPLFTMS